LEIVPITRKAVFHSNRTAYQIIPVVAHGLDARPGNSLAGQEVTAAQLGISAIMPEGWRQLKLRTLTIF